MIRLFVSVEGQTEESFVKRVLSPHLASFSIHTQPVVVETSRLPEGTKYRGGLSSFEPVRTDLRNLLRDSGAWTTTIYDWYGLPADFPKVERSEAKSARERVIERERELAKALREPKRFIPFFALHEVETWIFAAPAIAEDELNLKKDTLALEKLAGGPFGSPEEINHGPNTHPSKRLELAFEGAGRTYKKTADGPRVLEKLGLMRIRRACDHFNAWLKRLEGLGST